MKKRSSRWRWILFLAVVACAGIGVAACGRKNDTFTLMETKTESEESILLPESGNMESIEKGEHIEEQNSSDAAEIETESGMDTDGSQNSQVNMEDTVREDVVNLYGRYFKEGDFSLKLNISSDEDYSRLHLYFMRQEDPEGWGGGLAGVYGFDCAYDESGSLPILDIPYSYKGEEKTDADTYQILVNDDGSIEFLGDSEMAGTYYPEDVLLLADSVRRPLNESDLIGWSKEELRILRNQFYAVYGRAFENPELKSYFESQPWYRARVSGDLFDESVFNVLEKRNIETLKRVESNFDERTAVKQREEYEKLADVPYLSLLSEFRHMETSVTVTSDAEHTVDRGVYYEAEGNIGFPVIVTKEQHDAVVKDGKETEVCVNELTKEMAVMRLPETPDYGDCSLVYDSGDIFSYCFSYEPYSGCYTLWANSDDTLFKMVYEGKIFVLKGAEEEWYYNFYVPNDEHPTGVGAWRKMTFDEPEVNEPMPYSGNWPAFDEKGYVKALVYRGD